MRRVIVISNAVACLVFFLVAWGLMSRYFNRVYQYDTRGVFLAVLFPCLFVTCMAMRTVEARSVWMRTLLGGVAGVFAGTAAQAVVLVLEGYRFGGVSKLPLAEAFLSVLIMTPLLLTPIWGILATHLAAALVKLLEQHGVDPQVR